MAEDVKKGCGCCNHEIELEDNDNIEMLEDENGNQIPFHFITTLEYEGKNYIFLQSAVEGDEEFVEIFEIQSTSEGEEEVDNLIPVEDDLYDKLYELLIEQIESENEDDCVCDCDDCKCEEENCECPKEDCDDCDKVCYKDKK